MNVKQLDIFWVDLNPTRGAETFKTRPCVVLQSTQMNVSSRMVVVAPLLSGHKDWPFAVNLIPSKGNALDAPRHINLKQLRGVDVNRFGTRHGRLEASYFNAIKEGITLVFGIEHAA